MALFDPRKLAQDAANMAIEAGGKASDIARGAGAVAIGVAADAGNKAAKAAQDAGQALRQTANDEQHKYLMKKYKPLFPDEYHAPDFDIPKMIIIADEDARKGIAVCNGSIGWLSREDSLEVLYLYEEAIPQSGLNFHPMPICDAAYFVDALDSKRYINLSSFLEVTQQDKMTELRNIAFALGARHCWLETYESTRESSKSARKGNGDIHMSSVGKGKTGLEGEYEDRREELGLEERKITFDVTFENASDPIRPEVRLYAHDREIASLIEMRCTDKGKSDFRKYKISIDSSSSQTMSVAQAGKIDGTLKKLKMSVGCSFENEVVKESQRKMALFIEF